MQNIARTEALTSRDAWHARPNTVRGFDVFTLIVPNSTCDKIVLIPNPNNRIRNVLNYLLIQYSLLKYNISA